MCLTRLHLRNGRCDEEAKRRSAQRDEQTLGQQLAGDSAMGRAQRQPRHHFPGTRGAAREKQVCDIDVRQHGTEEARQRGGPALPRALL